MSDPYRSGGLACPKCGAAMQPAHGSFVCEDNGGEWITRDHLVGLGLQPTAVGSRDLLDEYRAELPTRCPMCSRAMHARTWGAARFDVCSDGIWIDDDQRVAFHAQLKQHLADEDAVRALAEELRTDEAGRLALARLLISLERRIATLEGRP